MLRNEKHEAQPLPSAEPTPVKQTSIYLKLILLGIIVIIGLQTYTILGNQPQTIIPRGTTFTLYNQYNHGTTYPRQAVYSFTVTKPSFLSGIFNITNPVLWFVMTSEQYSSYTCCNPPPSYLYGTSTNIIISYPGFTWNLGNYLPSLSGGVYYFVFLDNYSLNTTVTILDSIVVTPKF